MRIVQVSPFFHPHAGGVESHVRALAGEFAREGHDVTVVTSRYDRSLPESEEFEGYRIRRARTRAVWYNTPLDTGMGRLLASIPADVVHIHYPPPLTAFFAVRGLQQRTTPVCLTYHCDLYLPGALGRVLTGTYDRFFLPPTFRRVNRFIVHTQSYGRTSAALRNRPLEIIPSSVDLDRFRPSEDGREIRARLRLEDQRVIAFTGRLVPHQGIDVLLRALAALPNDVALLVVGRGPTLPNLTSLAHRLGVEDRVRFCPNVSDEELPKFLRAADLFVFPSQNRLEGFGLAVAEAMAAGLPVVIADMPGVREVIEPGVEGVLVEPLLVSDIVARVRELLDDPDRRRRMSAAARRRAEERYRVDVVAAQLLSVYRGLIAAG
ncbi:MAG: glycosyltransferase family 4 protein [Thermoplasmata archaeon]|nr:glycosyltransferase family 4 protein [Thermoplasmata archaeon]